MADENETVANVHDDMLQVVADEFGNVTMAQSDFVEYAVRFVAANKRELADKDAEIDKVDREYIRCIEELRATRERRDDCEVEMRKALDRAIRAENALAAKDSEIAKLRSLVTELANALDYARSCLAEYTYPSDESGKLVAKAREALNG